MLLYMSEEVASCLNKAGYETVKSPKFDITVSMNYQMWQTTLPIKMNETIVLPGRVALRLDGSSYLGKVPITTPSIPSRTAQERGIITVRSAETVLAILNAGFSIEAVGQCKYSVGPVLLLGEGDIRSLTNDLFLQCLNGEYTLIGYVGSR